MSNLIAYTSKHSDASFRQALRDGGIHFEEHRSFPPGTIVAVGIGIEIIVTGVWGTLAVACLAWAHVKTSRHLKITKKDGTIIDLKGYAADDAALVLSEAKNMYAIDTEKPAPKADGN